MADQAFDATSAVANPVGTVAYSSLSDADKQRVDSVPLPSKALPARGASLKDMIQRGGVDWQDQLSAK